MHTIGSPQAGRLGRRHGAVSHAEWRQPADLAEATGLTAAFTDALRRLRPRGTGHDSGGIVWMWR
ncbi:hypothetical protein [Streptomyces misionensis]|uniref:hypothetical protein n=1 Tax=Streptomyces misionensis TaxID=67331 RepID=UPI003F4D0865